MTWWCRCKRRQSSQTGSLAVSAARRSSGGGRGGIYAGIAVVVVVLAVLVAAGVLLTRSRNSAPAVIPPVRLSAWASGRALGAAEQLRALRPLRGARR